MPTFKAKTELGLLRLVNMGELDIFDALEAVPDIIRAKAAEEEAMQYEARRLKWLEDYRPTFSLEDN